MGYKKGLLSLVLFFLFSFSFVLGNICTYSTAPAVKGYYVYVDGGQTYSGTAAPSNHCDIIDPSIEGGIEYRFSATGFDHLLSTGNSRICEDYGAPSPTEDYSEMINAGASISFDGLQRSCECVGGVWSGINGGSQNCCGDDSAETWCVSGSSKYCDGSGNIQDNSIHSDVAACLCYLNGDFLADTCDSNGESDCWFSSGCCTDTYTSCGTGYSGCSSGTFYNNPDVNSDACECGEPGTQGNCDADGEVGCWAGSYCCGDDTEIWIQELGSTDVPTGYNDGNSDAMCCDSSTDCSYDGTCYNQGSVSPDAIPSKAYCENSNWFGGDYSSAVCVAINSSAEWNAAGFTGDYSSPDSKCCGDDANEYHIDDSSVYVGAISCCNAATDCVDADGDCVPSDSGASSVSDDGLSFCTAGDWDNIDDHQDWCEDGGFIWFSSIDGFAGTSYQCCGNDDDSLNDNFGRIDFINNFCRACTNGVDQGNETCMPTGTLGNNANDGLDTCLYDLDNLDTDRSNDCTGAGCILVTENLATDMTGVDDCQFGDPGAGDNYCLEDNNVVNMDSTVDQCYYDIACGLAGQTGWSMQQENCHDPNYDANIPFGNTCWYEPFGTSQYDRSDDCDPLVGCENENIRSCTVAVGQTCTAEPSGGFTGCVATQSKCDSDCISLGYNNGTLVGNSCNCGISDYSIQISSSNLVPIESTTSYDFNATATNVDNRFDYESELISMHICSDSSCSSLVDVSYFCTGLDGGSSQVSCTKNVISCDSRSVLFWMRLRDPVGNELYQISPDVYNVKMQDSCGCTSDSQCYSDYEGNGGCDPDESHCLTCVDKTDSVSGTCEYHVGCGAALLCDELNPNSCVAGQGWCNGVDGCGSAPNAFCDDEIVLDTGNSPVMCEARLSESEAHCGCVDNVDEGKSCDNDFDGDEGICVDENCVKDLVVQINLGIVSGAGAEYHHTCDSLGGRPCQNNVSHIYERDGTCVATNSGATAWACDVDTEFAYDGINYFGDCSLVSDGTGCDSDVAKTLTDGLYSRDGICTSGDCCLGNYIDTNNNALFDDSLACGTFGEQNEGLLCDIDMDYAWDGYVAYDNTTGTWKCVDTYWSFFDLLLGDAGDNETVKECIVGGVSCMNTFDSSSSYYQKGTCSRDDASTLYCDELTHLAKSKTNGLFYDACANANVLDGSECDSSVLDGGFIQDGICSLDVCCIGVYVDTNDNTLFDDANACESQSSLVKANEGKLCDLNQDFSWDGYVAFNTTSGLWVCSPVEPWSIFGGDVSVGCVDENLVCDSGFDPLTNFTQDGVCVYNSSMDLFCDTVPEIVESDLDLSYYDGCSHSNVGFVSFCDMSVANGVFSFEGLCTAGTCCSGAENSYVDADNNTLFDDAQCGCSKNYQGFLCDQNFDKTWDGYCVYNTTASDWQCRNNTPMSLYDSVFVSSGEEVTLDCDLSQGKLCDNTFVVFNSFLQDGVCVADTFGDSFCDTQGHSVYDSFSMKYSGDCNLAENQIGGYTCDTNVLGGHFVQDGYCADNGINTTCNVGLSYTDCDAGSCDIGQNQTYVGCQAGYACNLGIVTGFNWVQEGVCLNSTFCDTNDEIVFDGVNYYDDCTGNNFLKCDYDVALNGNYVYDGRCYTGDCDYNYPVLFGPLTKNTTRNNWIGDTIYLECLNATDVGSGINNDSYVFDYATVANPLEGDWNYVSGCTNSTYNCTWNITNQFDIGVDNYHHDLKIRCYAHDYSTLASNKINVSIIGIDNESPVITGFSPSDNVTGNTLIEEFRFNLTDNNPNSTLDRCEIRFYDNVIGELRRMEILEYPVHGSENIVSIMGFEEGTMLWNIKCYDLAHNTVQTENRSIRFPPNEDFGIEPLGELGFIRSNKKYTTSRVVNLVMTVTELTDQCKFKNFDGDWTKWEDCKMFKSWLLSESPGIKFVMVNVSHHPPDDDLYSIFSDSIYYDPEGKFLDASAPEFNYLRDEGISTINNRSLKFFVSAVDMESVFIGEDLVYHYELIESDGVLNTTLISDVYFEPDVNGNVIEVYSLLGSELEDGLTYYVGVNVTNHANLSNYNRTDGIIIDTVPPDEFNISSFTHPINEWIANTTATFDLSTIDDSIVGYSVLLDIYPSSIPDKILDLSFNDTLTYDNLPLNYFYLHVRAKDIAGNWGPVKHYGFGVDTTIPSTPVLLNSPQRATGNFVEFCWGASQDLESSINYYDLDIYDWNGNIIKNIKTNSTCYLLSEGVFENKVYYADVVSYNNANLGSDGLRSSFEPLEITFMKPSGNLNYFNSDYITLVVETNKNALCNYEVINNGKINSFLYSDGFYHESLIKHDLDDGEQIEVLVNCFDSVSYDASQASLTYLEKYPNEMSLSVANRSFYSGELVDLYAELKNDDKLISELPKENFRVGITLQGNSLYSPVDFVFSDRSQGEYRFTFNSPEQIGNYTVLIELISDEDYPYVTEKINLEVVDLSFGIFYDYADSQLSSDSVQDNLIFDDVSDLRLGIASSGKESVGNRGENKLDLMTYNLDDTVYFFVTKKDSNTNKLADISKLLRDQTFFDLINPSFGQFLEDEFKINAELKYYDLSFSDIENMNSGRYLLSISNRGLDSRNNTDLDIDIN